MSDQLTARQQEILQLIRDTVEHEGRPPTRAEICTFFGFRSPNAAETHLRALAAKGVITLEEGRARGIRLMEALGLPLIGRVAAGSPILAAEHMQGRYQVDPNLFSPRADYLLEDDVTVKRLSRKGPIVELLPANPDFKPIVVDTRNSPLEIEGLAVGLIRSESL